MKHLILLRHGAAGDAKSDRDRPLTRRGAAEARAAGEALRALSGRGVRPDRILCSAALRARETLDLAARIAGLSAAASDPALYLASAGEIVDMLQGLPSDVSTALVVGHDPGLSQVVRLLGASGAPELMARLPYGLGTGHLAALRLAVSGWEQLAPGCGELEAMGAPADTPDY